MNNFKIELPEINKNLIKIHSRVDLKKIPNLETDMERAVDGIYDTQLLNRYTIALSIGDLFDKKEVCNKILDWLQQFNN